MRAASSLMLTLGLLVSLPAMGAPGEWTTQGPWGGLVSSAAVDPNDPDTFLLAVEGWGGMFRTTDGGATWHAVNRGLQSPWIDSIAFSASQPGRVVVSTGPGIYLSSDGGDHWQLVHSSHPFFGPNVLAIDPLSSSILYAGNRDLPPVPVIERSTDGGITWQDASTGIGPEGVTDLVIDPLQPSRLYAIVDSRFFRSENGALTWTERTLPFQASFDDVPLAASPAVAGRLYAAHTSGGTGEVWRSDDAGTSWTLLAERVWPHQLVINPALPDEIFAVGSELWRSTDGGTTWTTLPNPGGDGFLRHLVLVPGNPPTLLINAVGKVFKSVDGGATWQAADTGVNGRNVSGFASAPGTEEPLIYASARGLFRRTATGWDPVPLVDSEGESLGGSGAIAIDPTTPTTLYVLCGLDVCRSTDDGAIWAPLGAPDWEATDIAVHPQRPQTLFVGGVAALLRSTDGGVSWERILPGLPSQPRVEEIAFDPDNPDRMWLRDANARIYRSVDGGSSFQQLSPPFTSQWLISADLAPTTLFATGSTIPVWKSTDGGTTWTATGSGLPAGGARALAASPRDPRQLYLQMFTGLFFHSTDAGATWHPLPPPPSLDPLAPSPRYYAAFDLAVSPGSPDTLLMGGLGYGIYELSGPLFADGFESGDTSAWDHVVDSVTYPHRGIEKFTVSV